jgi:histidinol-phosphate aminotransferase
MSGEAAMVDGAEMTAGYEGRILRLDANEGRCGLGADVLARILTSEVARRYPRSGELEVALSRSLGAGEGRLVATAGADDAIDRVIRSVAGPGGLVASTTPGFVEFLDAARRSGASFVGILKDAAGPFPVAAVAELVERRRPGVLVLASPDNPSGATLSRSEFGDLAAACRESGTVFLLDLTYDDFSGEPGLLEGALSLPGVVATGSFSKSWGLAGFRIGWAASGDPSLVERIREAGPPYSLSSPAIEAALAVLECDRCARDAFIGRVRLEREELAALLGGIGAETWPSKANFVCARVPRPAALAARLAELGVLVRTWPEGTGAEDLVRITCPGDEGEFRALASAIDSIGRSGWL